MICDFQDKINNPTTSFSLCLNMIVKNESHIIIDTLTKLCSKINFDYWVICDTGSTDNTKELIHDFFNNKKIEGELFIDEWVGFDHNRTLALERAFNKTDYLFIFDADDEIIGDFFLPKNIFEYDSYNLMFGSSIKYKRILLINNKKKYKFIGVLHELIKCMENHTTTVLNGNYHVISGRNSNRNNGNDKYIKESN